MIYRQEKGLVGSRMTSTFFTARAATPHLVLEFLVYSRVMVQFYLPVNHSLMQSVQAGLNTHVKEDYIIYARKHTTFLQHFSHYEITIQPDASRTSHDALKSTVAIIDETYIHLYCGCLRSHPRICFLECKTEEYTAGLTTFNGFSGDIHD